MLKPRLFKINATANSMQAENEKADSIHDEKKMFLIIIQSHAALTFCLQPLSKCSQQIILLKCVLAMAKQNKLRYVLALAQKGATLA